MSAAQPFDFLISPEPRRTSVEATKGNHVEITFVVRNISGRTVRAEPLINPLPNSSQMASGTVEPEILLRHMQITEPGDWEFKNDAVRTYIVRLNLPEGFKSGSYRFQLLIVGTDDPDNEVVESDVVTLTVSGPSLNPRPYLLTAVAVLAAIILLAVGAALFLHPPAQLEVVFNGTPPGRQMTEGKLESYTLKISNLRQEPLDNVSLDYVLPQELISASAFVQNSPRRNCRESVERLHCDLGDLQPGAPIFLTIEVLPGPIANHTAESTVEPTVESSTATPPVITVEIDLLKTMTFSRQLVGKTVDIPVDLPRAFSTLRSGSQNVYLVIDPEQRVALTGEVLNYEIRAWSHTPITGPFTLTYELPHGLMYRSPLPLDCSQDPTNYFKFICFLDAIPVVGPGQDVLRLAVQAEAFASAESLEHRVCLMNKAEVPAEPCVPLKKEEAFPVGTTAITRVVSTALMFDGVDDWAQLGLAKGLPTFTAEMWVHPFSTEDGQALISIHRQRGTNKVDNLFSIGYYDGGISVEVNGEYYDLDREKIAERFHLAVVVERQSQESWRAIVYINGQSQPWEMSKQEPKQVCKANNVPENHCKLFTFQDAKPPGSTIRAESMLDGKDTLPWSLGQEWDDGASAPKNSDFFYGSLSEVRVWSVVRRQQQIQDGMDGLAPEDNSGQLGYRPLEPLDVVSDTLADRASGKYPGKRIQANWEDITPRYGAALAFDGFDDSLSVNDLSLSGFRARADGKVELTMAGWFYVDGVPTRQQWLLGNAAPEFTPSDESGEVPVDPAQAELADAQAELAAASQVFQALNLDPGAAQADVQAARDELYRTLEPLIGQFDVTGFHHLLDVDVYGDEANAAIVPEALTTKLEQLIEARSDLSPELEMLRRAKLDFEREKEAQVDSESSRGAFIMQAARRAHGRALVEVWQTFARNGVTVTEKGLLPAALSLDDSKQLQSRIDALEAELASQLLPIRVLNDVAVLELAEKNVLLYGGGVAEPSESSGDALTKAKEALTESLEQYEIQLQRTIAIETQSQVVNSSRPALPDPDLVGYWKFDEGSGIFTSAYPDKGKPGRLSGGAAFISNTPTRSANPFALAFNGNHASVTMESPLPAKGISDLTLAFWINLQAAGRVIDIGSVSSGPGNYTCDLDVSLSLTCYYNGQSFTVDLAEGQNTWVHVVFQHDATNSTVNSYLNGILEPDNGLSGTVDDSADLSGWVRLGDAQGAFTGILDDLLIYQRALSAEEIERLAGGPSRTREELTAPLDALHAVQTLRQAQTDLNEVIDAQARLAEAQRAAVQADAGEEMRARIEADAEQKYVEMQSLETEANEARAAAESATDPAIRPAAQERLARADAALQAARKKQFEDLGLSITLHQEREQVLADLNPRLDEAVEKSVDAAQAALRRNNVELIVGPYLDLFFKPAPPRKTSYQAAYPAALLAAQLVLKTEAEGKVDLARARYNAAVEARDRLTGSSGDKTERQKIIDDINKYIDALNRDVDQAKAELDQAVEEQRAGTSDSPLQSILAEAMAQAIAHDVTNAIAARYPLTVTSTLTPDPRLGEAIKAELKTRVFSSLESVRRPLRLRLYYDTRFSIQRLDLELEAGIDPAPERLAKTNLRKSLMELNDSLLLVLNAEYALLRPAANFGALLQQVADEYDRATTQGQLIEALDEALKNASNALSVPELGIRLPSVAVANPADASTSTETAAGDGSAVPGPTALPGLTQAPVLPGDESTPGNNGGSGPGTLEAQQAGDTTPEDASSAAPVIPPPNIWAGLILTDDGHVAVVTRPAGAATWYIRKDERSIPVGRWVHFAAVIVYDAQTGEVILDPNDEGRPYLKLYRNGGSAKGEPQQALPNEIRLGTVNCAANFYIGGLCEGYSFRGKIDEVRIWDRALTAGEIDGLRSLPGEGSNELAYWSYDQILSGDGPDTCQPGQACDLAVPPSDCQEGQACQLAGTHNLNVIGPVWVPADPNLLRVATTR